MNQITMCRTAPDFAPFNKLGRGAVVAARPRKPDTVTYLQTALDPSPLLEHVDTAL